MIEVGKLFAQRYEVLAKIGEGGMGAVYKVRDTELNLVCALKLLSRDLVGDKESRDRFLREGKTMSRIAHKNVARIFRLGIEGVPYLVMDYLEGDSLREILRREEKLNSEIALEIIMQACEGMSAAHENNILHRDLKPVNIMVVTNDGGATRIVKVLDFGLARFKVSELAKSQHLTQTGALLGSIHYMSPEQCGGQRVDERSDIYALGCVLFECLTGHPPYEADSPIGLLHKHRHDEIPSVFPAEPSDPHSIAIGAVVKHALAKTPEHRYQTMLEFRDDIKACLDGETPRITLPGTNRQKPSTTKNLLLKLVVVCFAISVAAAWATVAGMRSGYLKFGNKPVNALATIDSLIEQKQYSAALDVINRTYELQASIVGAARLRVRKARCLLELQRRAEARVELINSIVDFSKIEVTKDLEGDVSQAIGLLVQCKETVHFLDDNYEFQNDLSWLQPARCLHASSQLARAVWEIFDHSAWIRSKLLELEKTRALKSSNIARARYYLMCADVEPTTSKREELGRKAATLFIQANERWLAAESFFLASNGAAAADRESLLRSCAEVIEPVSNEGELKKWQLRFVSDCAESFLATGNYTATVSFCRRWLNVAKAHPLDAHSVVFSYCDALRKIGRASEVKTFLLTEIAQAKPTNHRLYAIFQTALGDLNYGAGNARSALKAYLDAKSVYESDENYKGYIVRGASFYVRNLSSILKCCAYLDERSMFDRFVVDAEMAMDTGSSDVIKLDEMLRRKQYGEIEKWLKIHSGLKKEDNEYRTRIVRGTFASHCVRVGDIATAKAVLPELQASKESFDILMARIVVADEEQTRQLLDELRIAQEKFQTNKALPAAITICHFLLNDQDSALRLFAKSQDRELDPNAKLLLSSQGKVVEALRPDEVDRAVAASATSRVYEKILMARVASSSGHKSDVPLYLSAAKKEMLRLLSPDHPAVKRMDEKIANSTP